MLLACLTKFKKKKTTKPNEEIKEKCFGPRFLQLWRSVEVLTEGSEVTFCATAPAASTCESNEALHYHECNTRSYTPSTPSVLLVHPGKCREERALVVEVVVGGSRPITVKDHELSSSRSLTLSARFVAIKDSRPHLARLLLITHRNNKRSQAEIADASFH